MAYGLPTPPPAAEPVPPATAVEQPKVPQDTVAAGIAQRPPPPAMPLQSQSPDVPRFDGQSEEEQDR